MGDALTEDLPAELEVVVCQCEYYSDDWPKRSHAGAIHRPDRERIVASSRSQRVKCWAASEAR